MPPWLVLYFGAIDTVFQNRPDGFAIAGAIEGVGFITPCYTDRHSLSVYGVTYLPSSFRHINHFCVTFIPPYLCFHMVFRVIFVPFILLLSATICVSFSPPVFDIRAYILCQFHATVLYCPQAMKSIFVSVSCTRVLRLSVSVTYRLLYTDDRL